MRQCWHGPLPPTPSRKGRGRFFSFSLSLLYLSASLARVAGYVARSPGRRVKMHNGLLGLRRDHLGDEAAMTRHRIPLEAQQARTSLPRQHLRLRQLRLRAVRRHVLAEDRFHPLGMAGAHRIAPWLRRAQSLQMHIGDALLIQPGGKLSLGEARLARLRHGAHVDQQGDPCPAQFRQHLGDGAALVADGQQIGHRQRGATGCTPPGGARPFARMQRTVACFFAASRSSRCTQGNV